MTVWGMTADEYKSLLNDSFLAIKRSSRKTDAAHFTKTRILTENLARALDRVRSVQADA